MDDMTYSSFESRYSNREYIGSGGFAKVYKVFDHSKNHYVALKVADVRPEWKQFTLQREVELINRLEPHRNIARYDACYRFNTGMTGEMDFAILKFYEYGNLDQFLSREALTPNDNRILVQGILEGIAFLHRNNIIHRDLKSQNILLNREDGVWTPKITDFGLSRYTDGDHTTTNSSVGLSFAFAAPEQIRNQKIYKNVDLWAVGVIIYRIIAGELPFQTADKADDRSAHSQLEISQRIINLELPQKLNTLMEPYRSIIKRCLVIDPKERVQSAEELQAMLNETEKIAVIPQPVSIYEPQDETQLFPQQEDAIQPLSFVDDIHVSVSEAEDALNYPALPGYDTPNQNPTVVIEQRKKESTEITPPRLKMGEPNRKPLWLFLLIGAFLIAVVWLVIVWWNIQPTDPTPPTNNPMPVIEAGRSPKTGGNELEEGSKTFIDTSQNAIKTPAQ